MGAITTTLDFISKNSIAAGKSVLTGAKWTWDGTKWTFNGAKEAMGKPWVPWGVGGTIGAVTVYNILNNGLDRGRQSANEEMAKGYTDLFRKSMSSPRESNLLESAKSGATRMLFGNDIYPTFVRIKNGIGGVISETFDNWLNIAAIAGIFVPLAANIQNVTKNSFEEKFVNLMKHPFFSKTLPVISAAYLLIMSAKTLAVDVLGFGKKTD